MEKRRCGFAGIVDDGRRPVVWARGGIAVSECPKSVIKADSEALVEEYLVWKRLGPASFGELTARQTEAFVILQEEREREHGERHTRDSV